MSKIHILLAATAFLGFAATGLTAAQAEQTRAPMPAAMVDAEMVTASGLLGYILSPKPIPRYDAYNGDRYSEGEIIVLGTRR